MLSTTRRETNLPVGRQVQHYMHSIIVIPNLFRDLRDLLNAPTVGTATINNKIIFIEKAIMFINTNTLSKVSLRGVRFLACHCDAEFSAEAISREAQNKLRNLGIYKGIATLPLVACLPDRQARNDNVTTFNAFVLVILVLYQL